MASWRYRNADCAGDKPAYDGAMNRVIASARYLALAGVVFGLVAALAAFTWGGVKTVLLVIKLGHGELDGMAMGLVQIMDGFLIASGLLIFSLGLYELFVGEIALPQWLIIKDLDALKGRLAGVLVMVLAVAFLERLENAGESRGILEAGIGVALVSAVLVWMARATAPKS
jgi:uncharacterized membrane protein YqhA